MRKIPVSVFVLTKNEEHNISECLNALKDYKEVFVIDSNSEDNTVNIAKGYKNVSVMNFDWDGKYPKKKQWAIENIKTNTDWILFIDADEVFNAELNEEVSKAIKGKENAFLMAADVWFMDKKMKHGRKHSKILLLRKGFAHFPEINDLHVKHMWEVEGHYQPTIKGKVGKLKNKYEHNDKKGLYDMLEKHNMYSSWQAEVQDNIYGHGIRGIIKKLYHSLPFMPTMTFLDSYIFRLGFLDGQVGYDYAKFRAYYYWQTRIKKKELKNG